MRHRVAGVLVILLAVGIVCVAGAAAQAPAEPSPLDGKWTGRVTSDSGQMAIVVVVKVESAKASGSIETPHGMWVIKDGTRKDDIWTLPFVVEGATGPWMKGQVKGDKFTGEWNNAPMAVGTFDLTRVKK